MSDASAPVETWLYGRTGEARIALLLPGQAPPTGWAFSPAAFGRDAEAYADGIAFACRPENRQAVQTMGADLGGVVLEASEAPAVPEPVVDPPIEMQPAPQDERARLIAECEAKNITIDRRWGVDRLRRTLAEATGGSEAATVDGDQK